MSQKMERIMDRAGWPPGPWDTEPDSVSWVSVVGLPCEMRRGGFGIWCGYVGTDPEHPVWKLDTESVLDAHGGISLVSLSDEFSHEPAMPPALKWAGFDCGHAFDVFPGMSIVLAHKSLMGMYRDVAYVRTECECLAIQIDAVALLDEAGFDVTTSPEWAIEYARRYELPRAERLTMLRRLASDPVAAQLAESMGVRG
jgi:hypothetical protein